MKYEFYDPHPGTGGAIEPLPLPVKKVANKLSGQVLALNIALKRVQDVTDGKVFAKEVKVDSKIERVVLLNLKYGGRIHCWRVLRFREAK